MGLTHGGAVRSKFSGKISKKHAEKLQELGLGVTVASQLKAAQTYRVINNKNDK